MSDYDDPLLDFGNLSIVDDDPDLAIVTEFLVCWENAGSKKDGDAVLERYCAMHPRLAKRFRDVAETSRDLRDAKDPTRLGPYEIKHVLAIGGMGKVYEAEDETLHRVVAVKTIRIGRAADEKWLERFKQEREVLARLHHTHIVPIYGAGEDDGLLYFAMPLIKGFSLADLVATMSRRGSSGAGGPTPPTTWKDIVARATTEATRRRSVRRISKVLDDRPSPAAPLPPSTEPKAHAPLLPTLTEDYFRHVAEVLSVAAETLHSAHEAEVLHFDIKPSNILIERVSGHDPSRVHPWVIDFGLADAAETGVAGPSTEVLDKQQKTRGFGTPGFMAPEMLMLRDGATSADARPPLGRYTDVWSLGVTLYQLLTLHMPFATDQDVLDQEVRPKAPREHVPHLPHELEAVVLKALRKPIEEGCRYQTAAAFAEDLRRWLTGFPTEAGHAGPGERLGMWARRRPAAAFAAGMTAAFVIVLLLGAAQTVHSTRVVAALAQAKTQIVEKDLQSKKRELDMVNVARLRAPILTAGWFDNAWAKTRELAAGRPDDDGRFQGQFAALLEQLDVRLAKSFSLDSVMMLAFSPDGKRLLMGQVSEPGNPIRSTATIGHLAEQTGTTAKRFESFGVVGFGPGGEPWYLELDPADRSLLRLRDASTGAEIRPLKSPKAGVSAVTAHTLARDGSHAAGIVWPLRKRTPQELAENPKNPDPMTPDGDTATLVVWNLATGEIDFSVEEKQTLAVDLILSPDGTLLATWDTSGRAREVAVWSVKEKSHIGRFPSTRGAISSIAFGADPVWSDVGKGSRWRLAIGEHGGMITCWNLATRAVKFLARGTTYDLKTIDFSPDGSLMASSGRNEVRIWDTASGTCVLKVPAGNYQFAVAFSPDGRHLAVAKSPMTTPAGSVDVYDMENGRGMRTLRGLQQRIEKVAISADGRRVAALSNDWEVAVFDKDTGALLGLAEAPEGDFIDNAALALNADGTRLACSGGSEAKLWDVQAKKLIRSWKLPPALTEAAGFRPDGRLILIRQETRDKMYPPVAQFSPKDHPRVCRAYELPESVDMKVIAEISDFNYYVEHIAATPDAAYFAVQGVRSKHDKAERILYVYSGTTGKSIGSIETTIPDFNAGTSMRFDPKGTRLSVRRDGRDQGRHDLFDLPGLKSVGSVIDATAVNTGGSRWVKHFTATPDTPELLILNAQDRPAPLLRIVRDIERTGTHGMSFTPDGNHLVWGNADGTVTVCDLNAVQTRLAGVGLGWE